jgi:hypothetical protein
MAYENNEKCIELVSYLCKAGTVDTRSGGDVYTLPNWRSTLFGKCYSAT